MFGIDDVINIGLGIFNGIMQRHEFDKWFKSCVAIGMAFWCGGTFTVGLLHVGGISWLGSITGALLAAPTYAYMTWLKSPLSKDMIIVIPEDLKARIDAQPDLYTEVKGQGK